MNPIDDLDALLSGSQIRSPVDESLYPLLEASTHLRPLASAEPSPAFASDLHARLLAHAARQAGETQADTEWEETLLLPALPPPVVKKPRQALNPNAWRKLVWRGGAVALALIVFSVGFFAAVANARPGTPLYGVLRWEQSVQVDLASDPTDRARLHLQFATQALDLFDQTVAQHGGEDSIGDALATLRSEMQAASTQINALPQDATQATLLQQLQGLQARARSDLRADLPQFSWRERVETTLALGASGDSVVTMTQAVVQRGAVQGWQITLTGTHFTTGAVLLVNDQPSGTVYSLSPTQLLAYLSINDWHLRVIGIGEPDFTAAQVNAPRSPFSDGDDGTPVPGATTTPTGGEDDLIDMHGSVASVNQSAGSFTLSLNSGATQAIFVDTQTQYYPKTLSLSTLKAGTVVTVKGNFQSNGTFLAVLVQTGFVDE